ncbi:MAG: DUF503 domain-containing protein [Candidatus Omnitrophica bacterium]|nr:DUF503 domain-containing protein [Candidatus Omnitrophota bacterium]
MSDATCHIGVLYLELFIPQSQSLKDKRHVVKSLKDKARQKFNVSAAEIGSLDKWQMSIFAFAMAGNDKRHIDRSLQAIVGFIESNYPVHISSQKMEFV